ncbi:tRNA (adenosine(37)-N6)-dimethylallyltransferase MiaA, partial [Chromobacterium vaccinii]|nr:tRNA (adenosine(37)-N6)-dimethylallyltransferase MiaA [Chromobacterium vaccinii]
GLDEFVERGVAATRQLAKRQLTWTRSLDVIPVDAQRDGLAALLGDAVNDFLAGRPPAASLRYDGGF